MFGAGARAFDALTTLSISASLSNKDNRRKKVS